MKTLILICNKSNRLFSLFFLALLFMSILMSAVSVAACAEPSSNKIAVILVMDYCSIDDLVAVSGSENVFTDTDGALVSFRSGASLKNTSVVSVYASLSAGDRIYLPAEIARRIGNSTEIILPEKISFGDYYRRLNGCAAIAGIVYPEISAAKNYLDSAESTGLGLLGSSLKKLQVERIVFGNGDNAPGELDRSFTLLIVDESGVIDGGDVSTEVLCGNDELIQGIGFNYAAVKEKVRESIKRLNGQNRSGIIVIYPGDLNRLENYSRLYDKSRYEQIKATIIKEHLSLFKELKMLCRPQDLVMLMSVSPPAEKMTAGSVTGFLFIRGPNYVGGKLLTSATTRKTGRLFLSDVTNTIASYFGAGRNGFKGNLIKETDEALSLGYLKKLNELSFNIDMIRASLIKFYVFLIVAALFTSILAILASISDAMRKIAVILIYAAVTMPLFFAVAGPLMAINPSVFVPLTLVLNSILVYLIFKKNVKAVRVIASSLLVLSALIALDAPFSYLNSYSVLGYSFNTGARFYGIGNEHMGFYAAGIFLLLAFFGDRYFKSLKEKNKFLALFIYCSLIILGSLWILMPFGGANVGGSLAVLIGSVFASYHAVARKLDTRLFIYLLIAISILFLAFAIITFSFPGFHLSKFIKSLIFSNYTSATAIIYRKLNLNLNLLWYTVWNKYLIAILISLLILVTNPGGILSRFFRKDTWGESLLTGTAFGAITAFIFNDSGVVAAATMLIYPMMIFVAELMELKYEGD